jgi:hypothetical protein
MAGLRDLRARRRTGCGRPGNVAWTVVRYTTELLWEYRGRVCTDPRLGQSPVKLA